MANESVLEVAYRKTQLINEKGKCEDVLLEIKQEDCMLDESIGDSKPPFLIKKLVQPYHPLTTVTTPANVNTKCCSSRPIIRGPDYHTGWVQGYRTCLKDVREMNLRVRRHGPWGKVLFKRGEGANATPNTRKICTPTAGKAALVVNAAPQVLHNKASLMNATAPVAQPIDEPIMPKVEVKVEDVVVKEEITLEMMSDSEGGAIIIEETDDPEAVIIIEQTDEPEDASWQVKPFDMASMEYLDSTISCDDDKEGEEED